MQKKSLYGIIFLVAILALTSLACSLSGGDEPAAEVPTAAATAEMPETAVDQPASSDSSESESDVATQPEPTAEPIAEPTAQEPVTETSEEAPAFEGLAIDSVFSNPTFESYEFNMDMSFTGIDASGNPVDQTMNFTIIHTANPPAYSMTVSGMGVEGMEEGLDNMSIVQMGDTTYMVMAEFGCMTMPSTDEDMFADPMGDMFDGETFNELDKATYEGRETVNGIETHHYSFDESNMSADEEVEWVDGHIYLAVDGGYLVRMTMDGEGMMDMTSSEDESGTLHLEMNLTNVNQPIEITLPADCATMEGGSEYPMMEDAYEVTAFPGLTSYKTNASVEDVGAFYEQVLSADGWEYMADSSFSAGGSSILAYQRDGTNISLTIGPDTQDATATSVVIIGE